MALIMKLKDTIIKENIVTRLNLRLDLRESQLF